MADDDYSIVDAEGDVVSDVSSFGNDPEALGVEPDGPSQSEISAMEMDSDVASAAEQQAAAERQYGFTWRFDETTGDLEYRGNSPVRVEEEECFAEWAAAVCRTQSRENGIAGEGAGIDFQSIVEQKMPVPMVASFLESEIEEALSVHNRFDGITGYECEIDGDIARVNFNIVTSASEVPVTATIGNE